MPRKQGRQAVRNKAVLESVSWQQRLQRLLLKIVVTLGCLAVLVGVFITGSRLLDLRVEQLVLEGAVEHVAVGELETQLAPTLRAGFLTLDLDEVREQLEIMPWVYRAGVRRRWPNVVVIKIEEQRPIARWGLDGFLNHEGEYFPAAFADRWSELARLEGPEGSEHDMTRRYQSLEALLEPTGLQVVALHEDSLGQVSAELHNGVQLALGADHHRERIGRFVALWREQLSQQPVMRVDMRYEHGAAVALLPTSQWAVGDFSAANWQEKP
jgi:cell division protein FtsQ